MPAPNVVEIVDAMCRAHHEERRRQGYATKSWDELEGRNQVEYKLAMHKALDVGVPMIAEATRP